ncbi:MAG TPA: hypothetical protein DCZ71_08145 [Ruminococcus sp.]|nr:hypothetical protein [Ruminococcus sp.]
MKKRAAAVIMAAGVLLTGCTMPGSSGGDNPPVEVSAGEREALARKLKYLPLTETLYGAGATDEQIAALDARFNEISEGYNAALGEAVSGKESFCTTNFLPEKTVPPLSSYSPLASVFYSNGASIGINPVVLVDKLTEGSRKSKDSVYTPFSPEHDYSVNAPRVYENRNDLVREALSSYVSPETDFDVTYYKSENLYCVNIASGEKDLLISAMYFHFSDDGTLDRGGMDQVIYTGRELMIPEAEHSADAALTFPDGDFTRYDSPCSTQNLSSVIIRLLGSAVSEDRLVTGAKIKADESYRTDQLDDSGNIKGVHIVSWFELDK